MTSGSGEVREPGSDRCPRHGAACSTPSGRARSTSGAVISRALPGQPNGRRLAMTLGEIGGRSGYVGLHVIDVATRHRHASRLAPDPEHRAPATDPGASAPRRAIGQEARMSAATPGRVGARQQAARLRLRRRPPARRRRTTIYLINANGTGRRRLPTRTTSAYWPSWSPDGTRIAFATAPRPHLTVQHDTKFAPKRIHSDLYTTRTDGSDRALLARAGSAPSWSPDGKLIAYEATAASGSSRRTGSTKHRSLPARARTSASPASRSGRPTARNSRSAPPTAPGSCEPTEQPCTE